MSRTRGMTACRGNALMEYVVPASIILISAGVLVTITDATQLMAEYFLSASGRTKASLEGSTFKIQGLAEGVSGRTGNGLGGFQNFAGLKDGAGGAAPTTGGGMFYSGNVTHSGAQPASSEYLFP